MVDQSDFLTPTTALQATNIILEAIGQTTVASLDTTDTNVVAEKALNRLYEISRAVQTQGWKFNQDLEFPLEPNSDGEVVLPANALRVRKVWYSGSYDHDLTVRAGKIYDRKNHTFQIEGPIKVDLVVLLPFEDLPEYARNYITIRAARVMAASELRSDTAVKFTSMDEERAMIEFEQGDAEEDDRTLYNNPHFRRLRRR